MLKIKPLREPRANQISTSILFYSKKLGRQVWCESNLEWDVAIIIEIDPTVVDYCEQAIELKWSKSTWIPDFVVLIRKNNEYIIQIIEVKYLRDLIEKKHKFEEKYTDTRKWLKNNEKKIIKHITDKPVKKIEFLVVADQIINQSFRIENFRKIIQASIDLSLYTKIKQQVDLIFTKKPKLMLRDLFETVELKFQHENIFSNEIWTALLVMIRNFDVLIDFETLFTIKSSVYSPKVYKNNFESVETWFKKFDWKSEQNNDREILPYADLYGIAKNPKKSIELWEEAKKRLEIIETLIYKPVSEIQQMQFKLDGKTVSGHTVYRWLLDYQKNNGDIRCLIPKYTKKGRNNLKTSITEELWQYGKDQYFKMERKSMRRAHEVMQAYAQDKKQLESCMSYSTFRRRIKNLNLKEVMKKRIGDRDTEKLFELSESQFPHGDYALQSVQIDHTPIDVLVVDKEYRLVTEKPYLIFTTIQLRYMKMARIMMI